MLTVERVTPAIGAEIKGLDFSRPLSQSEYDQIYDVLIEHLVIFIRGCEFDPQAQLAFAQSFGELDEPHPLYPSVEGFDNIVLLENDAESPPDTNAWHTDLTFKEEQPFASILLAKEVPTVGGDTLWSSCYAAYDRLPRGMKDDLERLVAVHDMGDFRNEYAQPKNGQTGEERLNEWMPKFGHKLRSLIGKHPVTRRKFLNFNETFVSHIIGLPTSEANALHSFLASHMNAPEDQVRWRWANGDLAMWDNRVTMHYAVADYLPQYRCMNRITVVRDRRASNPGN